MRIVVDAMGGDFAPNAQVEGAFLALEKLPKHVEIDLIGQEDVLSPLLKGQDAAGRIKIVHAPQVVDPKEPPAEVLKAKPQSSMVLGLMMCKEKKADAFISAGSTGAQVAASLMILGRLEGVLRPTVGAFFPNINGNKTMLIDVGASVDSKPQQIVQFAQMASIYFKSLHNIEKPSVGLVNIGEEESKGNESAKQSYIVLKQAHDEGKINFYGNIEGRDIMFDVVNIAVCDGFIGNIILKFGETVPKFVSQAIKQAMTKKVMGGEMSKEQAEGIGKLIKEVLNDFSDEKYGGLPLLGVNGISVVCHGKSSSIAISRAILQAAEMIEKKVTELIKL